MGANASNLQYLNVLGETMNGNRMPRNIEIKAYVKDADVLQGLVYDLTDSLGMVLEQEDIFFTTTKGRLKLRVQKNQETLGQALGVVGVISKKRRLSMYGQTRIHLDVVEGLGNFVELEVVLDPQQSGEEGQLIAEDIMQKLNIEKGDLIPDAYMDLVLKARKDGEEKNAQS